MCACSVMSDSFATPWTVAHKASLSTGFSMQEYSSGLSYPPQGTLPDLRIEFTSPAFLALADRFFRLKLNGWRKMYHTNIN